MNSITLIIEGSDYYIQIINSATPGVITRFLVSQDKLNTFYGILTNHVE